MRQEHGLLAYSLTSEILAKTATILENSAKKPLPMHSSTRRADLRGRIGNEEKVSVTLSVFLSVTGEGCVAYPAADMESTRPVWFRLCRVRIQHDCAHESKGQEAYF